MADAFRMEEKLEFGPLATFMPNKARPVYNWLYYKEGFSRELVIKLLNMFSPDRKDWVLDPFCGVGTTLLACLESGVNSVGFDVHPLSVFASRVKLAEYDLKAFARGSQGQVCEAQGPGIQQYHSQGLSSQAPGSGALLSGSYPGCKGY
jgi:hypothetical protein